MENTAVKVFEFSEKNLTSKEWIVADSLLSAIKCFSESCDMYHEANEGFGGLEVKQLSEDEIKSKRYDPDPQGTGEFNPSRAIPFSEAIRLKNGPIPYLLCSLVD